MEDCGSTSLGIATVNLLSESDVMSNWIECDKELPPDGVYVLVATDDTSWVETHFIEFDFCEKNKMWFSSNAEAAPRDLHSFTHWQHIPKPPVG